VVGGVTMVCMASQVVAPLETGREAASRHAWREAYDAFTSVGGDELTPFDLASFADAAWWSGKLDEAIDLRERSYAAFAATDEKSDAARVASPSPGTTAFAARSRSLAGGSRTSSGCWRVSRNRPSRRTWPWCAAR
jgi:hypothetical protein